MRINIINKNCQYFGVTILESYNKNKSRHKYVQIAQFKVNLYNSTILHVCIDLNIVITHTNNKI